MEEGAERDRESREREEEEEQRRGTGGESNNIATYAFVAPLYKTRQQQQ